MLTRSIPGTMAVLLTILVFTLPGESSAGCDPPAPGTCSDEIGDEDCEPVSDISGCAGGECCMMPVPPPCPEETKTGEEVPEGGSKSRSLISRSI